MNNKADLIKGPIAKSIFMFAIPLLIGNLFQQLYNTVDAYVVGNYVGKEALAAVGAASPILNMMIGFFMGLATGAGVIIAQYFGAEDQVKLKKSIHTSIALTLVMSVVITVVGVCATDWILTMVKIPSDVFNEASLYLRIYFGGVTFSLIYNMGAGILRAIGDSKRPLYFLVVGCLVNIVLDFVFVKFLNMGVAGAGYATLIAQAVCALLVAGLLLKTNRSHKVYIKDIRFDKEILKSIIKIGIPTAVQNSIVSLSNVVVQSYVNAFGSSVVAGYSASIRIDGFIHLPLQSFSMAVTTFVGQNIGAKNYDRVKKGAKTTLIMTLAVIISMSVILFSFGREFIAFFNQDPEVIEVGWIMVSLFAPFYCSLPFVQVTSGVLRGAGKSTVPMYIMTFNFVILRQIYLAVITQLTSEVKYVFMAWPVTWVVCAIMFMIYYYKVNWLPVISEENSVEEILVNE